eukprot:331392-Chlamydomonas_euryale.AAC.21
MGELALLMHGLHNYNVRQALKSARDWTRCFAREGGRRARERAIEASDLWSRHVAKPPCGQAALATWPSRHDAAGAVCVTLRDVPRTAVDWVPARYLPSSNPCAKRPCLISGALAQRAAGAYPRAAAATAPVEHKCVAGGGACRSRPEPTRGRHSCSPTLGTVCCYHQRGQHNARSPHADHAKRADGASADSTGLDRNADTALLGTTMKR